MNMSHYALIFISVSLFSLGIIFLFKGKLFKSQKSDLADITGEIDGPGAGSEEIQYEFARTQLELNDLQKVAQENKKAVHDIKRRVEEDKVKFHLET